MLAHVKITIITLRWYMLSFQLTYIQTLISTFCTSISPSKKNPSIPAVSIKPVYARAAKPSSFSIPSILIQLRETIRACLGDCGSIRGKVIGACLKIAYRHIALLPRLISLEFFSNGQIRYIWYSISAKVLRWDCQDC